MITSYVFFLFSNLHFYFKAFFNSLTNATMRKFSHLKCTYIQPICKLKIPNKFDFRWCNIKVPIMYVFKLFQFISLHHMHFPYKNVIWIMTTCFVCWQLPPSGSLDSQKHRIQKTKKMQPRREMSHRTCFLLHGFYSLQCRVISLMDYVCYLRMESINITDAWDYWSYKQDENNVDD